MDDFVGDGIHKQEDQREVATEAIARLSDTWCESVFMLADLSPTTLDELFAHMEQTGWDKRLIAIIMEAVIDTQHDDAIEHEKLAEGRADWEGKDEL